MSSTKKRRSSKALRVPKLSYTDKVHWKRRFLGTDWLFLGALLLLLVAIFFVLRHFG